jgi:hypothetical protein
VWCRKRRENTATATATWQCILNKLFMSFSRCSTIKGSRSMRLYACMYVSTYLCLHACTYVLCI